MNYYYLTIINVQNSAHPFWTLKHRFKFLLGITGFSTFLLWPFGLNISPLGCAYGDADIFTKDITKCNHSLHQLVVSLVASFMLATDFTSAIGIQTTQHQHLRVVFLSSKSMLNIFIHLSCVFVPTVIVSILCVTASSVIGSHAVQSAR
jgi:hypothetical protein